jgi:hypothetical protein
MRECAQRVDEFGATYRRDAHLSQPDRQSAFTAAVTVQVFNPDGSECTKEVLEVVFRTANDYLDATLSASGHTERLRYVLDDVSAVSFEHRGRLVKVQDAARILLAPALFGMKVHVPETLVRICDPQDSDVGNDEASGGGVEVVCNYEPSGNAPEPVLIRTPPKP